MSSARAAEIGRRTSPSVLPPGALSRSTTSMVISTKSSPYSLATSTTRPFQATRWPRTSLNKPRKLAWSPAAAACRTSA